jgi:hypothetical protein
VPKSSMASLTPTSVSARILPAMASTSCTSTLSVISSFRGFAGKPASSNARLHLLDQPRILELAAMRGRGASLLRRAIARSSVRIACTAHLPVLSVEAASCR